MNLLWTSNPPLCAQTLQELHKQISDQANNLLLPASFRITKRLDYTWTVREGKGRGEGEEGEAPDPLPKKKPQSSQRLVSSMRQC